MINASHDLATAPNWHRLDVCRRDSSAQTRVSVIGALDADTVKAIDRAVKTAEAREHSLILDLGQISSVTPQAMNELLSRGGGPRLVLAV